MAETRQQRRQNERNRLKEEVKEAKEAAQRAIDELNAFKMRMQYAIKGLQVMNTERKLLRDVEIAVDDNFVDDPKEGELGVKDCPEPILEALQKLWQFRHDMADKGVIL